MNLRPETPSRSLSPSAIRALLFRLVDYAGLFPPASLGMAEAVERYGRYRFGETDWALGRFVIPASRLEEFEAAVAAYNLVHWRLSAVVGEEAAADFDRIRAFNERHPGCIDMMEAKADSATDVTRLAELAPNGVRFYVELDPASISLVESLIALKDAGHSAKLRMGGDAVSKFPPADTVAWFLLACAHAGVSFKATAGLHHPLRSAHRLTYADDSAKVLMHGFVNLFLAAAVAHEAVELAVVESTSRPALVALLEEQDPLAFTWTPAAVVWRRREFVAARLARIRHEFARSFGSCSFEEPLADLRSLGWL